MGSIYVAGNVKTDNGATYVNSFNGRSGVVTPQAGDYTAEMVGALPITGGTLQGDLSIASYSITSHYTVDFLYRKGNVAYYQYPVLRGIQNPSEPDYAANKAYVDSMQPDATLVTLTSSGWSNNTQTVTVSGVVADESKQLITVMPAIVSQVDYMTAGIYASGQAANSLTFTCSTAPTTNLSVYVVVQAVR